MKIFFNIVLVLLVLLASSSGITKIMLIQREVDFFSQYGFTNPILIGFGVTQLMAGLLLVAPKTRIIGALLIAITFLISAVLLLMSSSIPMAVITLIFVALAGFIVKQSLNAKNT